MTLYQINWNGTTVGTVKAFKEGLYYRFDCVCRPVTGGIHRIFVSDGHKEINLGICAPAGQDFALNTRIPSKYLHSENFMFYLVPKREDGMIPVKEGMSFSCLNKLDNACIKNVNGMMYIVINQSQGQQDSDQNQEHPNK